MENGGREQDHGSESDEDEDSEQNISDSGRLEDSSHSQNTASCHVSLEATLQAGLWSYSVSTVCLVSRSRLDSEFQGIWRNDSLPDPTGVGQLNSDRSRDT